MATTTIKEPITVIYTVGEEHYLEHQLYGASRSGKIKKKRQVNKAVVGIAYMIFAVLSYYNGNMTLAFLFTMAGFLWIMFYPKFERRRYVKHYKGFIKENYKEIENRPSKLVIEEDVLHGESEGSSGTIQWSEVAEIVELPKTILIKLKSAQSLVLPKDRIENIEPLKDRLRVLAGKHNIWYANETAWQWR